MGDTSMHVSGGAHGAATPAAPPVAIGCLLRLALLEKEQNPVVAGLMLLAASEAWALSVRGAAR